MIRFSATDYTYQPYHYILFDEEGMGKMDLVLNRALNTHHDKELTDLLDSIKDYQERS